MNTVSWIAGLALAGALTAAGVAAITSSGARATEPERSSVGIESVASLAGVWRAEHAGRVYQEMWMAPEHGQMTGALRSFDEGGVLRLLELLTLTQTDQGLVYSARHFDAAMNPWASEADGPLTVRATEAPGETIRFEPVEAGGALESITFDLSKPGHVRVSIAFVIESSREPLVLDFERVGDAP